MAGLVKASAPSCVVCGLEFPYHISSPPCGPCGGRHWLCLMCHKRWELGPLEEPPADVTLWVCPVSDEFRTMLAVAEGV